MFITKAAGGDNKSGLTLSFSTFTIRPSERVERSRVDQVFRSIAGR
jgi:hypothetical protein